MNKVFDEQSLRRFFAKTNLPMTAENWPAVLKMYRETILPRYGNIAKVQQLFEKVEAASPEIESWLRDLDK